MRKSHSTVIALIFMGLLAGVPAQAAEEPHIAAQDWSFSGPFGTFDTAAQQRGLQVYTEVCKACHGLTLVAFRSLEDLGYSEDEIKAYAAGYTVVDGPNDAGEMFDRAGVPSDYFPSPFPNEKAAAAANNGAAPPDLSLVAKSRAGGPDYIYALLTGYKDPPPDFELLGGLNYNAAFPGHQIAMPQPISDDAVTYSDGTPATVEQMSHDVATFLMWAAEPDLVDRKRTGIKVMLFLIVFTGLLYATKRKVWSDLH